MSGITLKASLLSNDDQAMMIFDEFFFYVQEFAYQPGVEIDIYYSNRKFQKKAFEGLITIGLNSSHPRIVQSRSSARCAAQFISRCSESI
jgi:hypothetical protein